MVCIGLQFDLYPRSGCVWGSCGLGIVEAGVLSVDRGGGGTALWGRTFVLPADILN